MLTKKEAIRRHRLMWNWIADETEKQGRIVEKREAFAHFGWNQNTECRCWCCEYDREHIRSFCGEDCIIAWPGGYCVSRLWLEVSPFTKWCEERDPVKSAKFAREIANLPKREDV